MENVNWIEDFIILGEVKERETVEVKFIATRELKIKEVVASCGCSTPKYDKKAAKEIVVAFKTGDIPHHLKSVGSYTTTKSLSVYYEDGGKDVLRFRAKVVKK